LKRLAGRNSHHVKRLEDAVANHEVKKPIV